MPQAIVYQSATGATARYAKLLGAQTGLPVYSLKESRTKLEQGTPMLFMGYLKAGRIQGFKEAVERFQPILVAAIGLTPPSEDYRKKLAEDYSLPIGRFFYLQGGVYPQKLGFFSRTLLRLVINQTAKEHPDDPAAQTLARNFSAGKDSEFVSEDQLAPVYARIQKGM